MLEDCYTLFCNECYRRKLKTKLKDLQNFFLKKQRQFTERPFHLNIEKRKTTEKKLSDEVLKKTFHTHSDLVPKRRQSCISIRSVTSVDSPVKAGDIVTEVNGIAVTDENIQEVTQILQRELSQPLYITIERTTKECSTQEYKSDAVVKDSDIQKPSDPHRRLSDQTQLQTDQKISNEQQKLLNKEHKISDEQLLRTERQISNEQKHRLIGGKVKNSKKGVLLVLTLLHRRGERKGIYSFLILVLSKELPSATILHIKIIIHVFLFSPSRTLYTSSCCLHLELSTCSTSSVKSSAATLSLFPIVISST